MSDILKKAISLGLGLTAVSKEKVEQFVNDLVVKGEITQSESKEAVNRLIARGEEQRLEIKSMVQEQVKRLLSELDIATKQDLKELEHKLKSQTPPTL